ncbi:MAG: hypothetical protein VXX03_05865 [Candidatus Thermoplasmatota archaeon]|nr:hypothetical protein [Candidatus Thermoplasmatota archaeon]MEC7279888.1 hypothetical protein [Candidatus Thermoplasmatota archaeon]MEC9161794.1 hypothetical protein [Candidatus Thermoplasmatota archaeon]
MDEATGLSRVWSNPVVRGMLLFSAFRAVYGTGILAVTWLLATSDEAPWWTSLIFLAFSMVFSRLLLRGIKARWPGLWGTSHAGDAPEPPGRA